MEPPCPAGRAVAKHRLLSDGIGGKVWRVVLDDGTVAALKQASADGAGDALRGADYLRWRAGDGTVRLIDRQGDIILMEWAGDRRLLDHSAEHGDLPAIGIAAETVTRLHAPRAGPWPATLLPLRAHFSSLFEKAEADRLAGAPGPFVDGAVLADRLLDGQRGIRPLHGDIHHENILFGARGWLAIDPKGLIGDPVFDVTNLFHNPPGSAERMDGDRAAAMAGLLAGMLGRDIETVLEWTLAYSCLSAAWYVEDDRPEEIEDSLSVHGAVKAALAQVRA